METGNIEMLAGLYRRIISPVRKIHDKRFRRGLETDNFTLLSSNCLGGVIYHMLGMKMLSPTVNMVIGGENFLKLIDNPQAYLVELDPFPIDECYSANKGEKGYPVIGVGDIVLNCIHYKNCKEAVDAWDRRRQRVNLDKLLILSTNWDLEHNDGYVDTVLKSAFPKKIFFDVETDRKDCVFYNPVFWEEINRMPALTDYYKHGYVRYFEKYVDIVKWINQSLPV